LDLVIRDGSWYVVQDGQGGKYRPFEAALSPPGLYELLLASRLDYVSTEDLSQARFDGHDEHLVRFRTPPSEAARRQMETLSAQLDTMLGSVASQKMDPKELEAAKARLDDLLENGVPIVVDSRTGVVVERGATVRRVVFRDLQLHDRVSDQVFEVSGADWPDHTAPFAAGRPDDMVAILHGPVTGPKQSVGGLGPRLLDAATGDDGTPAIWKAEESSASTTGSPSFTSRPYRPTIRDC
jgi:hypothetical protein